MTNSNGKLSPMKNKRDGSKGTANYRKLNALAKRYGKNPKMDTERTRLEALVNSNSITSNLEITAIDVANFEVSNSTTFVIIGELDGLNLDDLDLESETI